MIHVVLLVVCAVAIYFACEWFVNSVEWLGAQLKVGAAVVGTVLAAIGTALPESVVTLVAALFGSPSQGDDIAVGSAMGGPLVVGTIAYGVTGAMLLLRRRARRPQRALIAAGATDAHAGIGADDPLDGTDVKELARDQRWFLFVFVFKVGLGLIAFAWKPWLGVLFFAAYGLFVWRQFRQTGGPVASVEGLEPLKLQPRRPVPAGWAVAAQTLVMLAIIFIASRLFVAQLEWVGPQIGLSPIVVALLLAPIATELPEVLNAIIWVRQGKTDLALGNLSGSMMIQATVPSGIGILFTPWKFDTATILAGAVTMASVLYLLWLGRTKRIGPGTLAAAAGFYLVFAVTVLVIA